MKTWLAIGGLCALMVVVARADEPAAGPVPPPPALGPAAPPPYPILRDISMAQLRERLAPSAAQQALWNAFDARVQAYLELVYREKAVSAAQGTSAPRQLAQRVDHARNRLAAMEDVEDAVRGLYASLSPEQQKTADQLLVAALPGLEAAEGDTRMSGEDRRRRPGKGEGGMRQRGGMGGAGMGGH